MHIVTLIGFPLYLMHAGFQWSGLLVFLITLFVRVWGITAGYHRYFSHRSFKTSRVFQFIMGLIGTSSAQLGPLWWAAHHRHHHKYSDTDEDIHSPHHPEQSGRFGWLKMIWYSHIGWILDPKNNEIRYDFVKNDLAKYPELRLLDKFYFVPPILLAVGLYFLGGWNFFWWGFMLSTIVLYHLTFCINSVTHLCGVRKYETTDESKNVWWLAIPLLGEGWHNNHHNKPSSCKSGEEWWEIDITYYSLWLLSEFGIVWDLKVKRGETA